MNTLDKLCDDMRELQLNRVDAIDHLKQTLGPYNITARWENTTEPTCRVLLSAHRTNAVFTDEFVRMCNGLVLEYPSWNILSIPPPLIKLSFRVASVANNMASYDIYEIKDGTTVTFYYYNDRWCISSAHGYDISNYKWLSQITYMDAITNILKSYPDFDFDKLDVSKSYTIGFRHHDFHPLRADPNAIWLIQPQEDIGLPLQTPTKFNSPTADLFSLLVHNNKLAKSEYMKNPKNIHYGYILRAKPGTNITENSNIIMESTLLCTIRQYIYNIPKRTVYNEITIENRLEYIILRVYMSQNISLFTKLFPHYTSKINSYANIFKKLAALIYNILRNANQHSPLNTKLDILANNIINNIENHNRINVNNRDAMVLIADMIIDMRYFDLYFKVLCN